MEGGPMTRFGRVPDSRTRLREGGHSVCPKKRLGGRRAVNRPGRGGTPGEEARDRACNLVNSLTVVVGLGARAHDGGFGEYAYGEGNYENNGVFRSSVHMNTVGMMHGRRKTKGGAGTPKGCCL